MEKWKNGKDKPETKRIYLSNQTKKHPETTGKFLIKSE